MANISNCRYRFSFIVKALKVSMLGCSLGCGTCMTDDALEKQLHSQYQLFQGRAVPYVTAPVCKAVQFMYHLLENPDEYLARKLAMLIGRGAGVDGISQRPATEDERKLIFSGLYKAKEMGAKEQDFFSSPSPALWQRHQVYVSTVYHLLTNPLGYTPSLPGFINFAQKTHAYAALNQKAKIHYAVKTQEWSGFANQLSPQVITPQRSWGLVG